MQFELIDCINGYAAGRQELDGTVTLRGLLRVRTTPGVFDLSDFARLMCYVRERFDVLPEIGISLCVRLIGKSRAVTDQTTLDSFLWSFDDEDPAWLLAHNQVQLRDGPVVVTFDKSTMVLSQG